MTLGGDVRLQVLDENNELYFSPINMWQVHNLLASGAPGFKIEPGSFLGGLIDNGYSEVPLSSAHVARAVQLRESVHTHPLDRLILAQAQIEGMRMLTVNGSLAVAGDMVQVVTLQPFRSRTQVVVEDDLAVEAQLGEEDYNGWSMF